MLCSYIGLRTFYVTIGALIVSHVAVETGIVVIFAATVRAGAGIDDLVTLYRILPREQIQRKIVNAIVYNLSRETIT